MLRSLKQNLSEMRWLEGPYESGSDRPAIELLAGDDYLIEYLNGRSDEEIILNRITEAEKQWIERAQPFLLYDEPLFQIS
jgi:hypothetical protein